MRHHYFFLRTLTILSFAVMLGACSSEGSRGIASGSASIRANNEGKNLANPVAMSPASVASGKKLYDKLCADCHGVQGDGVSEIAATMAEGEPKPSDLTDDLWDNGSTDGEIFVSIRDGVGGNGAMKGLNGRPGVGPNEMWNMVNYIRSLHRQD